MRFAWRRVIPALILLSLGSLGCLDVMLAIQSERCRVLPLSLDALDGEVALHARVRMQVGGRDVGFDAVAERREGPLRLVGLAPAGTRLFSLTQTAETIVFGEGTEGAMRSLATMTLDALRRGVWIDAPPGERHFFHEGEAVRELEEGGRLRREFRFSTGAANAERDERNAADVSIEYLPKPDHEGAASFEVRNSSCGYEAVVVLLGPTE